MFFAIYIDRRMCYFQIVGSGFASIRLEAGKNILRLTCQSSNEWFKSKGSKNISVRHDGSKPVAPRPDIIRSIVIDWEIAENIEKSLEKLEQGVIKGVLPSTWKPCGEIIIHGGDRASLATIAPIVIGSIGTTMTALFSVAQPIPEADYRPTTLQHR